MKKLVLVALCFCATLTLSACSSPDDGEKGGIENFTDEIARDATDAIHTPLDKARGVQDIAQDWNDAIPQENEAGDEEW